MKLGTECFATRALIADGRIAIGPIASPAVARSRSVARAPPQAARRRTALVAADTPRVSARVGAATGR